MLNRYRIGFACHPGKVFAWVTPRSEFATADMAVRDRIRMLDDLHDLTPRHGVVTKDGPYWVSTSLPGILITARVDED